MSCRHGSLREELDLKERVATLLPGIYWKELKTGYYLNKFMYIHVHSKAIHKGSDVKTTQNFINGQMMIYPYNRILFSHEKELSTDT